MVYDSQDVLTNSLPYGEGTEFGGVDGLVQPPPHVPTGIERMRQIYAIDPADPGTGVAAPELEGAFNTGWDGAWAAPAADQATAASTMPGATISHAGQRSVPRPGRDSRWCVAVGAGARLYWWVRDGHTGSLDSVAVRWQELNATSWVVGPKLWPDAREGIPDCL